eukprot:TRINITY_DN42338_c0_g1_i1.p2 TRINITY_DN42338_c0_g1~~TRINITY_DN42338_c0_g1_i1.p2  ORF type:complete len:117 (+),score=25.75 TRINITY_DN42338_c0_g1_i1:645-995(+)
MKPCKLSVSASCSDGRPEAFPVRGRLRATKVSIAPGAMLELLNDQLSLIEERFMGDEALTITGIRGLGTTERMMFGRNWDVARFLWDGTGSPDDFLIALTQAVGDRYDVSWSSAAA